MALVTFNLFDDSTYCALLTTYSQLRPLPPDNQLPTFPVSDIRLSLATTLSSLPYTDSFPPMYCPGVVVWVGIGAVVDSS